MKESNAYKDLIQPFKRMLNLFTRQTLNLKMKNINIHIAAYLNYKDARVFLIQCNNNFIGEDT